MERETQKLLEILADQTVLLDRILETQKKIKDVVNAKDWEGLGDTLAEFDKLAGDFPVKEAERNRLCAVITGRQEAGTPVDMFAVLDHIPQAYKESIRSGFMQIRRKLAVSRIENAALNDYLRITGNFLQGIFNHLTEKRTNTVYSRSGGIVRSQPDRLILDTLL
jgi:hypothetical protein